jgi:hypothetical protein
MPVLNDERQNERDQQEIKEVEHIADRRSGKDLPLIDGQLLLLLQMFEHRRSRRCPAAFSGQTRRAASSWSTIAGAAPR